ncbi:putative bifunctional diguanylate cyclase/phosphodiesterase [Maritalea mediterranea]|uniref:EAL domain-containing protein n=1 Tax=Maritalea mediterranea TaxID=2909667 RepID=A0ABS9E669_9HYPH|nr:EAL domain-containing protein [Maritalea mediterranea]MCF4098365.1 EAL domain-containing protein [Maritalea mediterranea]
MAGSADYNRIEMNLLWLIKLGWVKGRVFAYCALGTLFVAAILQVTLFAATEDAVSRSMHYDVSWAGANGRIEAAHFEKHAARFAALGDQVDAEKARLFYEIFLSRLKTWDSGGFPSLVLDRNPRQRARFEKLRSLIDSIADDVANLEYPEAHRNVLSVLAQAAPIIDRIGSDAHTVSVSEADIVRSELQQRQFHQRLIILALLIGAAALIGLIIRQNTSLHRAKVAAERSAKDFSYLARHDSLTTLPNRTAFDEHFRSILAGKTIGKKATIFTLDLDGFKAINDLLGHPAGDALLVSVARRLMTWAARCGENYLVSRLGGDEFIILAELEQETNASHVAEDLLKQFKTPFETKFGNMAVGATVGFASRPISLPECENLLLDADLALTEAKAQGKGRVLEFEPNMRSNLQRRQQIERDISFAVETGQIEPHYQLQVDLRTGQIFGFEALARWKHPEFGWVSPSEFIPIAESCGDVVGLGKSILRSACFHANQLPMELNVSVNLSVVQLHSEQLVEDVAEILQESGLAPHRLTLEVTESIMISDTTTVLQRLDQLKRLGVAIALDDFGTGYSALSYLTKFAWNELKIDRSFTEAARQNPANWTIIRAVNILANNIGARVIAEGIETTEQEATLKSIGCDIGQGFLYSRPLPFEDLEATLRRLIAQSHQMFTEDELAEEPMRSIR